MHIFYLVALVCTFWILLNNTTRLISLRNKIIAIRRYFRSVWTSVYYFWAHLIWAPKLSKPGEKKFL